MNGLIAPGIYTFPDCFDAAECASWIAMSEGAGFEDAMINTRKGGVRDEAVRNNSRIIRNDAALAAEMWQRLRNRIPPFIDGRQAIGVNERFRFYRYTTGQHFAGHSDGSFRRDNGEESRLTLMIYLNDDFAGGETAFAEVVITPARGMALLFRHELFHEGRPVLDGVKYVLRSDVMFNRLGRVGGR